MCGFQSLSRQDNQKNDFKIVQLGLQCLSLACFNYFLSYKISRAQSFSAARGISCRTAGFGVTNFTAECVKFCRGKLWALDSSEDVVKNAGDRSEYDQTTEFLYRQIVTSAVAR